MSRQRRFVGALVCILWSVVSANCGFDEGPSLQVDVRDTALAATTGDADLCCCRVVGVIENLSTVPVHVTLEFKAYETVDSGEQEVGTAVAFLKGLGPAEQRQVDAPGLLMPCSQIDRFELVDTDIRGVWFPPS